MAFCFRARPGRLLATALIAAAFFAALCTGVAGAAEEPAGDLSFEQLFIQLQSTPVYKDACTETCHGNIAQTKNYSSAIIFQHGYHQLIACSSCHTRFPHRADTTIERPTMKGCFACHGVRHGPMGIIASGECSDCHVTPKERLRPAFHTFGWAGREHVEPSNKEFNTRCAMCHTPQSCNDCHTAEAVEWTPASWDYNAGDGCLACHGNTGLAKQAAEGLKSFTITGVDSSAHSELTCQQCHTDYRYDDKPNASPLWSVNAGQACADCHRTAEDGKWVSVVEEYEASTHAEKIKGGDYDSATCASCHGGHFIYRLDTQADKDRMHLSAYRTCARCKQHGEDYDTYDDYYHGKAYKAGNLDAPSCWNCHESHAILPSADPSSSVAPAKVAATCGREGCHSGSDESFGKDAAALIHEKVRVEQENPLRRLVARLTGR